MKAGERIKSRLLKPEEAAWRLGVSKNTVKKWLRNGRLPGVKVGTLWRIEEEDLERYIKERKQVN